ncbi:MAG TPA: peptidoglycan recognition family protein [Stenomitos sp.]
MRVAQSKRFSIRTLAVVLGIVVCLVMVISGQRMSQAQTIGWVATYRPNQVVAWASNTNFGERVRQDANGMLVSNPMIVVIHETVSSADSAIRFFQTPHPDGSGAASYHAIIRQDGSIVYTVPFAYRAFGAGNSVFMGDRGLETVQTTASLPPSVNNFAYHFSLETPPDGNNNGDSHSGYTVNQYQSLAMLVDYTKVPDSRVTFHRVVDRSGTRKDPRSFNDSFFGQTLYQYRQARYQASHSTTWVR